jgi:hypothetical protein
VSVSALSAGEGSEPDAYDLKNDFACILLAIDIRVANANFGF